MAEFKSVLREMRSMIFLFFLMAIVFGLALTFTPVVTVVQATLLTIGVSLFLYVWSKLPGERIPEFFAKNPGTVGWFSSTRGRSNLAFAAAIFVVCYQVTGFGALEKEVIYALLFYGAAESGMDKIREHKSNGNS